MINPAEGGDFHLAKTGDFGVAVDTPGLHAHTPEEVLAKLNEERNPAKHTPNSAVSHWLRDHWECVAYLIEKLTGHVA